MEGPLAVFGERTSGDTIRTQNVTAASAIANIVKSSLGPVGLDKMLVDDIGVTSFFFLSPFLKCNGSFHLQF
uniref:T-complex protein 1 subunit alpha n=1 Tax=Pavo cristatus TaxID=9049 RepID=A0A8C9FIE7_PAVCR